MKVEELKKGTEEDRVIEVSRIIEKGSITEEGRLIEKGKIIEKCKITEKVSIKRKIFWEEDKLLIFSFGIIKKVTNFDGFSAFENDSAYTV